MLDQKPTPGITGLDHAVLSVRDLDAARDTFTRMGFTLAPRGLHSTGSSNHNIMLETGYFELLNVPQPNPLQRYFYDFAQHSDGMAALALTNTDPRASLVALQAAGFEPSEPQDFSRRVDAGSKTGVARFTLTNLSSKTTPGAQVFLCRHFTPELVWLPELTRHANGAVGLAGVSFIADNVAHQAGLYARIFGSWPERIAEGLKVSTGSAPIGVANRQALQARLTGVDLPDRARPFLAVLFIRVKDRQETFKTLRAGGFNPKRINDGSWAIDAGAAHGVAVVFG